MKEIKMDYDRHVAMVWYSFAVFIILSGIAILTLIVFFVTYTVTGHLCG